MFTFFKLFALLFFTTTLYVILSPVSTYSFRHSWATIAQVVFEAGLDVVGLCLNHASPLRVTAGYVKTDFSIIDRLNIKILRYVFEEKIKKGGNNL